MGNGWRRVRSSDHRRASRAPEDAGAFPTARRARRGNAPASVRDEGVDAPRRDDLRQAAARARPSRADYCASGRVHARPRRQCATRRRAVRESRRRTPFPSPARGRAPGTRRALGVAIRRRRTGCRRRCAASAGRARARFRSAHGRLGTITGRPAGPVKPGSARTCR